MAQKTSAPTGASNRTSGLLKVVVPALTNKPDLPVGSPTFVAALVLRLGGAGLLAYMGYIHLYLWDQFYKALPTNGPLFIIDAITAFVLTLAVLAVGRAITGLVSAIFVASTLFALVISLEVGLFGFQETITGPDVVTALTIESIAVVVLLAWAALLAWAVPRHS